MLKPPEKAATDWKSVNKSDIKLVLFPHSPLNEKLITHICSLIQLL